MEVRSNKFSVYVHELNMDTASHSRSRHGKTDQVLMIKERSYIVICLQCF